MAVTSPKDPKQCKCGHKETEHSWHDMGSCRSCECTDFTPPISSSRLGDELFVEPHYDEVTTSKATSNSVEDYAPIFDDAATQSPLDSEGELDNDDDSWVDGIPGAYIKRDPGRWAEVTLNSIDLAAYVHRREAEYAIKVLRELNELPMDGWGIKDHLGRKIREFEQHRTKQ